MMMWFRPGGGGANGAGIGDGAAVIGVWGGDEVRQGGHDGGKGKSVASRRRCKEGQPLVGYGLGKVPSGAPLDMDWAEDLVISHVSCTKLSWD